jgi:Protein of unknown function (DUF2889)
VARIPIDPRHGTPGPTRGTPARVPGSVRRTLSIDMTLPDELTLVGRARDLHTRPDGTVEVVDTASFDARVDYLGGQVIRSLQATPDISGLDTFVGRSASRGYRRELHRLGTEQGLVGRAVYQLLDDVPGAALVSGYSPQLDQRDVGVGASMRASARDERMTAMAGVCAGWQEGGVVMTSIAEGGVPPIQLGPEAPSLVAPDDPWAWHEAPGPIGPHEMRRVRRIDVVPGPSPTAPLSVDAFFRDSYTTAAGVETIVHEYTLLATVDPDGTRVLTVEATPRVLPFGQCPEAAGSAGRLPGTTLDDLRTRIRADFVGASTCTHLNDMLRALEDVAALARRIGTDVDERP